MVFVDYITKAPKQNMTPPHVWGRAFAQENYYYQNLMRVKQEAQDFLATRGMSDESARLPQLSSTENDTEPKIGSMRTDRHPLNEVRTVSRNEANLANIREKRESSPLLEELVNSRLFSAQKLRNYDSDSGYESNENNPRRYAPRRLPPILGR